MLAFATGNPENPVNAIPPKAKATCQIRFVVSVDPEEFLRAEHAAQGRGRTIVGVWHSHPRGEPVPSATDRAEAWPDWSYLIAGVTNGALTDLRCWRLADDHFREQPIVTANEPIPDRESPDERT